MLKPFSKPYLIIQIELKALEIQWNELLQIRRNLFNKVSQYSGTPVLNSDLFDQLQTTWVFSKIYLRSAYD